MFDVLTVAALADELTGTVLDGRIQKLGLVNGTTVAAEVYANRRRHALVASADSDDPAIWLADRLPSTDPGLITPFGLQLRKYVRGGFLIGIEQPALERVIRLSIVKRLAGHNDHEANELDDDEAEIDPDDAQDDAPWSAGMNRVELIVEIMGRHSNLILVDGDGLIMESAKRVTSRMSRVRPVLPKLPYTMPPPPDKPDPRRLTSAGAESLLAGGKPSATLADVLVRGLRGVSPQIGREVAFRLTGNAGIKLNAVSPEMTSELARHTRNLLEPLLTRTWQPVVYKQEDVAIGYAAVPMSHLAAIANAEDVASVSAAVDALREVGGDAGPRDHAQRRARIVAAIDRECEKVSSRLHSLQEQHRRSAKTAQLREWGETIFAYLWHIQPGDSQLVIDDLTIPLDPALSAKDNAQAYFDEYRKAQRAGARLPEHIAEAETERSYLRQLRVQADQAEGFAAIETIRQEFDEHTGGRQPVGERPGNRSKKQAPRRVTGLTEVSGNVIYIGRSGRENDQVTFDIGGAEDTWLHVRGVPGSHVIVRWLRPAEDEDERAVETAAALAAHYSGSRTGGLVEVDVTRRKNVRKIKGAGPGMVTYRNERTIAVRPQDEASLKAEGRLD
ncbi:MAG: NFACT family protein [Chloroflexia bacterium]|nr:NFACT family protein [Chloroflexia bacterium]